MAHIFYKLFLQMKLIHIYYTYICIKCGHAGQAPVSLLDVACGEYSLEDSTGSVVLLCFPIVKRAHHTRYCWSFNGTDFELSKMARSKHESITLAAFDGAPVAVSGFGGGDAVEILRSQWESVAPLPFNTTGLFYYSTVSMENQFFLFGGRDQDQSSICLN